MTDNLSVDDRNIHIRAVVKSNLVGFALNNTDIDYITSNLTDDLIDVMDNYKDINNKKECVCS